MPHDLQPGDIGLHVSISEAYMPVGAYDRSNRAKECLSASGVESFQRPGKIILPLKNSC